MRLGYTSTGKADAKTAKRLIQELKISTQSGGGGGAFHWPQVPEAENLRGQKKAMRAEGRAKATEE